MGANIDLTKLKINKLSNEKYQEMLANGEINADELYLTPSMIDEKANKFSRSKTLADIQIGDNLRGATLTFDTSFDIKTYLTNLTDFGGITFNNSGDYDGKHLKTAFMSLDQQNQNMFYFGTPPMPSPSTLLGSARTDITTTNGWLMSSFTIPNDQDYIVTANTFIDSPFMQAISLGQTTVFDLEDVYNAVLKVAYTDETLTGDGTAVNPLSALQYLQTNYLTTQELYNAFASTFEKLITQPIESNIKTPMDIQAGNDILEAIIDTTLYKIGSSFPSPTQIPNDTTLEILTSYWSVGYNSSRAASIFFAFINNTLTIDLRYRYTNFGGAGVVNVSNLFTANLVYDSQAQLYTLTEVTNRIPTEALNNIYGPMVSPGYAAQWNSVVNSVTISNPAVITLLSLVKIILPSSDVPVIISQLVNLPFLDSVDDTTRASNSELIWISQDATPTQVMPATGSIVAPYQTISSAFANKGAGSSYVFMLTPGTYNEFVAISSATNRTLQGWGAGQQIRTTVSDVEITGTSGSIGLRDLTINNLDMSMTGGMVSIEGCNLQTVNVSSTKYIEVLNTDVAGVITINSNSETILFKQCQFETTASFAVGSGVTNAIVAVRGCIGVPTTIPAGITLINLDRQINNAGQIKANYTGLSQTGFTNGTIVTMPLNTATVNLSAAPTTKFPYNSPTDYTAMFLPGANPPTTMRLRENNVLGQVHRWRVRATYANKASGNNGNVEIRLHNPDSGFIVTAENTMPTGLTSGLITCELTTIADSASLDAGKGYILEVVTSFTDSNLVINITDITRDSEATENIVVY